MQTLQSNLNPPTSLTTPAQVRQALHNALSHIGTFEQCALLDYPSHFNIGDRLIWAGEIHYLAETLKTHIGYCSSAEGFSAKEMEARVGKAPILLHGGGNLGDLWTHFQTFREQIIANYHDRPIVILPQTIYFAEQTNLQHAAAIFNAHPNLTLFVRDHRSYEIASTYFGNCHVIKAPDMAFELATVLSDSNRSTLKRGVLYHCRQDAELNESLSSIGINLSNLTIADWVSDQWVLDDLKVGKTVVPGSAKLIREGWQRGFKNPVEWWQRQQWQQHPHASKFNHLYGSYMHQRTWSLIHDGIYQFKPYQLIITNRLHGHILATLLGIPNILLPNSYYKNQAFYETWTHDIASCRFVNDPSQIEAVVNELIATQNNSAKM